MAVRDPLWDETFLECMMDDVKEVIEDAKKSRRKVFEQAITMESPREVIVITVRKERR